MATIIDSLEDQLALAAIHFLRGHYQEATEIYKRLLLEHRDYLALQVYIAICYYKLDYYDVSSATSLNPLTVAGDIFSFASFACLCPSFFHQCPNAVDSSDGGQVALEILAPYLTVNPDSAIAINLKACSNFRLYDGKAAAQQLQAYIDKTSSTSTVPNTFSAHTLVSHNLVVFRSGENALKVLPPMIDILPEARLNLCIHYLKSDDLLEAHKLMEKVEPTTPQE